MEREEESLRESLRGNVARNRSERLREILGCLRVSLRRSPRGPARTSERGAWNGDMVTECTFQIKLLPRTKPK